MIKYFHKLKKPYSWPIFPIFAGKSPITQNFIWVSNTMSHFRKNLIMYSMKTPGQAGGWTDGRTDPILQDFSGYCQGS